jgi:hypothetical protein
MTTTGRPAIPFLIFVTTAATVCMIQCGGSTTTPTVATMPGVSGVALNATSVAAGSSGLGTVSLTGAALAGGASISLSSSNPAVATVQTPVSVQAGSSSVSITVTAVSAGTTTITAALNGSSSQSPMLTVTAVAPVPAPVATAIFGVSGPHLTETCELSNNGKTINCTFDGSTSTAPGRIVSWQWSYGVAATFTQTTSGPVLTMPVVDCSLVPPPPMPAGNQWFTMTVTLKIRDDLGNVSALTVDDGARLLPHGMCGF